MKLKSTLALILIFSTLSFSGCLGLLDNGSDHISGNYYTGWIDLHSTRSIYIEHNDGSTIELVPAYVYAVGHDPKYIFAKQHPLKGTLPNERIDLGITNYYIVSIDDREKVHGPMTKCEFEKLLREKEIEGPNYDLIYPEDNNY